MRQIFLDTETTGLSPESGDRIIEIGCVEMVNRRLSGRDLHFFVNPERPNSEDAFKVHGLSDEFLADKPLFGAIADELLDYLAGAEIIIHNASFDVAFLNQELRRIGRAEVTRVVAKVTDIIAPCVPLGLASGRIGNFINGELWGRPADPSLPWAMAFPQSGSMVPRHPSPLYQFALEGLLLFVLLWLYARRERRRGQVSGMFLVGYGLFRFIAEYFREPDAFLGLLALNMSMGQWLCVPMVLAGLALWFWGGRRPVAPPARLAER